MITVTIDTFDQLLAESTIKPRLKKELRFVSSVAALQDDWSELELVPVTDRSGNKGALIISVESALSLLPYEIKRGLASGLTGRAQPIICDLCRTWQSGSRAGSITFLIPSKQRTITYLCCSDLRCSAHVRSKTSASKTSRSQLREDMTTEDRVERLQARLKKLVSELSSAAL